MRSSRRCRSVKADELQSICGSMASGDSRKRDLTKGDIQLLGISRLQGSPRPKADGAGCRSCLGGGKGAITAKGPLVWGQRESAQRKSQAADGVHVRPVAIVTTATSGWIACPARSDAGDEQLRRGSLQMNASQPLRGTPPELTADAVITKGPARTRKRSAAFRVVACSASKKEARFFFRKTGP